ncbi:hypothetical protein PPL_02765 [Heterostelium album PN500]|uniref:RING-type domain-containing protein n=1 Tax=Heterostelium pallidum (strain ATCC 26659 / Pp 5 / PN500) TaxID=670386 RepID=D3B300_HETP5|nr:hypothetical protein PPL_02765 [Heterostelium album PN500]EFA83698.1 hypothetical protein PPL_02765 [Heterostelium album PN500]|eukprot:XP_020435815.1 hypothetical protein PPL_02765 [Heterostelium album PN500]
MEDEFICCICMCGFDVEQTANKNDLPHRLKCSHCFHKACFEDWFRKQHMCPLCREPCQQSDLRFDPIITQLLQSISKLTLQKQTDSSSVITTTTTSTSTSTAISTTPKLNNNNNNAIINNTKPNSLYTTPVFNADTSSSSSSSILWPGNLNINNNNNNSISSSGITTSPVLNNTNTNTSSTSTSSSMISKLNQSAALYSQQPQQTVIPIFNSTSNFNTNPPHSHTLQKVNPVTIYKGLYWQCNRCSKKFGTSEQYHCYKCENFDLCRFCCLETKTPTTPEIGNTEPLSLPRLHQHSLYCMSPLDVYEPIVKTTTALATTTTSTTTAAAAEPPKRDGLFRFTSLSQKQQEKLVVQPAHDKQNEERRTQQRNSILSMLNPAKLNEHTAAGLPNSITIPIHSKPLQKHGSPLEVYDTVNWICDVCRSHKSATIETFFHSPDSFDLCLNCYHKQFKQ